MTFGYSISKSSTIDLDQQSKDISARLLQLEPSFATCIGCGSCMATCSAGHFTTLNLRRLQLLVRRGQTDAISAEAQKCMLCGKCQIICPRGVNTRNIVLNLHNLSSQKSKIEYQK